jgi:hypothetical protein
MTVRDGPDSAVEVVKAMELHEAGQAKVVPVVVRPCIWNDAPFAKLQAIPKGPKAVISWPNQDEAFSNIADEVMQLAKELQESKE